MATCQTSRWVSTAPYVKLTVTQDSSDGDSAVYDWKLQYIASSAASVSSARSYTVKIAGDTVKTGTYSINGKSGTYTIASGKKTINRGTSSKKITIYCSFTFNLTWSGSYAGTKTASDSFTLAAKTSYTVDYDTKGGTGGPTTQTKWHGDDLTLSSAVPTKTDCTFLGWATSVDGAVAYSPLDIYSTNESITLYAVWRNNYVKPTISNLTVSRCTADGTLSDSGTYALVNFNWLCTKTVTSIIIEWVSRTNSAEGGTKNISVSGTSGSVAQILGNGALNTESAYSFSITVTDDTGSASRTIAVNGQEFPIDFLAGGKGVAFGKPATEEMFECEFPAQFNNNIHARGVSAPTIAFYTGNNAAQSASISANTSGNLFVNTSSRQYQYTSDRHRCMTNDAAYLGDSNYKWKAVYAVNGTIQTSDRNQKENINIIERKYEELFNMLKPVTFELKGNEHDRIHIGFIAQDVKESMDELELSEKDLAAFCMDIKKKYDEEKDADVDVLDENGEPVKMYSLRYSEFIALNTHMIQKQQTEIEELKAEIKELKALIKGTS